MKSLLTKSKISITVIMLLMTIICSNLNWYKDFWKSILEADAKGYYAYLPAIFIYKDLNFGFFDKIEKEKYYEKNLLYDYRATSHGKTISKYYIGTALAELPFFLIAHLLSYLLHYDMDGFSKLYPIMISIGALFYLLIGLIYLNALLNFYKITELNKSIVLFASVFGTNLFYYTVGEPGLSHLYSFAFITMFIYYCKRYFLTLQNKYIVLLAAILGIICLIRPTNGLIILFIPFAADNLPTLKQGLLKLLEKKIVLITSVLVFAAIVFIQPLYYKLATGHFLVYSYDKEGFNFLHPHFIDILFSYRNGLFVYTPLYLLSLAGGFFLWKSSRFKFYTWFAFFVLITYVFSSWHMWYYGGFSSRVFIEYISLFMILLAISLNKINLNYLKKTFISAIVVLVLICQIQTYQFRYYHIHWADMTKEKYWDVFLRIDRLIK